MLTWCVASVLRCSDDFFAAVKAAFTHPEHCIDPLLRKDYVRLIKAVNLRSDVFNKQQRAQLEVYTILVGYNRSCSQVATSKFPLAEGCRGMVLHLH